MVRHFIRSQRLPRRRPCGTRRNGCRPRDRSGEASWARLERRAPNRPRGSARNRYKAFRRCAGERGCGTRRPGISCPRMCASNSSRKCRSVVSTGFGAMLPQPAHRRRFHGLGQPLQQAQVVRGRLALRRSASGCAASAWCPRGRARTCRTTPPRKKPTRKRAMSTMQAPSSSTMMPPVPIIDRLRRAVSGRSAGRASTAGCSRPTARRPGRP